MRLSLGNGKKLRHDRGRWLNNRIEQDHRRIKRLTRPMLGLKSLETAERTIAGIEAMAMIRKGQVPFVRPGDRTCQATLIRELLHEA